MLVVKKVQDWILLTELIMSCEAHEEDFSYTSGRFVWQCSYLRPFGEEASGCHYEFVAPWSFGKRTNQIHPYCVPHIIFDSNWMKLSSEFVKLPK